MILAADVQLNASALPPTGFTLSPLRPSLVVEVNGRPSTVTISSGSVEAQPIDGVGALTGAPAQLIAGTAFDLGASGRWRLAWDGGLDGASAPLVFS